MGLFSKKPPCPICGGKISWFLPTKIEGEYICDSCSQKVDIEPKILWELSMQEFRECLKFYEIDAQRRAQFIITDSFTFGFWGTKIIFDTQNKWFCVSDAPNKTIFEASQLKSIVVKEDFNPLITLSSAGITRYNSSVVERANGLATQILFLHIEKLTDRDDNTTTDIREPFERFYVELQFDHPYWSTIEIKLEGPRFDNQHPDIGNYLCTYHENIASIEHMIEVFGAMSFSNVVVMSGGITSAQTPSTAPQSVDAIEEIRKYKSLMEEGIITQEEFNLKKRQLLGI